MENTAHLEDYSSFEVQPPPYKPRIRALEAILQGDLNTAQDLYIDWRDYATGMILRDRLDTQLYKFVKASKRGNDVHRFRTKRRFDRFAQVVKNQVYYDFRDRSKPQTTGAFFVSLTYARDLPLAQAWLQASADFNRFISAIRKHYPGARVVKTLEAQRDGYVHIHAIIATNAQFTARAHRDKDGQIRWRIDNYKEIQDLWKHGFSDIQGVADLSSSLRYISKYITKATKDTKSLTLNWVFNRRQYSISSHWHDLIRQNTNSNQETRFASNQTDLFGEKLHDWELIGFWGGSDRYGWSSTLTHDQYKDLIRDQTYLSLAKIQEIREWKKKHWGSGRYH